MSEPPADGDAGDYVRLAGRSRAGPRGTAVLLLHGLGGRRAQLWDLAPTGTADCLAPDLRGHGTTPVLGPADRLTFAGLAADVQALLAAVEHRPAVVVGVSMGAGLAVRLAAALPDVRALVLLRPAWGDELPPPNLLPLVEAGAHLHRYGADEGRRRFLRTAAYRAVERVSAAAAASLAGQFDDDHAVARADRLQRLPHSSPFAPTGAIADLRGVPVPAVVVGAAADPVHPLHLAEQWAGALPAGRLVRAPSRDADPAGYEAVQRAEIAAAVRRAAAG